MVRDAAFKYFKHWLKPTPNNNNNNHEKNNKQSPVMDWRPVQGVPCLSPNDGWDRLQHRRDPELD